MMRFAKLPALAILIAPTPCLAWGAEGHRIVAAVAEGELSPAAQQQVSELLGSHGAKAAMVSVSTRADEIRRQFPNTAPLHFVDIPLSAPVYDPARDCPRNNCLVAQTEKDERIVADRQLAAPGRAEALRFLIHFVGDITQPLHNEDNDDRGGNRVQLILGRRHTNLHAVWDVDVVRALGRDSEEVAARLEREITPIEKRDWSTGRPEQWANEAHQTARIEIYSPSAGQGGTDAPICLTVQYACQQRSVAAPQLEKPGVRLAAVLNTALR